MKRSRTPSVQLTVEALEDRVVRAGNLLANANALGNFQDFVQSLSDPTIAGDVQAAMVNDGGLGRGEVLNLVADVESSGTLSAEQLSDLQAVAANYQVENMPSYVANLLGKVVGDNPANGHYQGAPLGDLAAGSSATQLANLVDKWFYGGDLPAADPSTTYTYAQGSLFGPDGVPHYTDVVQGWAGSCYFLAPLAETAYQAPGVLQNQIIDNGDGTFDIGFNMSQDGSAPVWDYVTVNRMFPAYYQTDGNGNPTGNPLFAYANYGQDMTDSNNVLWAALYEKAYAQIGEEGWTRGPDYASNSYDAIGGGNAEPSFLQIGAMNATGDGFPDPNAFQLMTQDFAAGRLECLWTGLTTPDPNLNTTHCYTVLNYDPFTGVFTIYNPYGSTRQLSWDDVQADFVGVSYTVDEPGKGLPTPDPARPANLPAVAYAVTHSQEYFDKFVVAAYQRYLNRTPDGSEVAGWAVQMEYGLTDEQVEAGFIGSYEYIVYHGGPGAGWVRGMYEDLLGRTPAQSEVDGWVANLDAGWSPEAVAYGFAASYERETQRVQTDYQSYLGRQADADEVGGWASAFERGWTNEDIVTGFIDSQEYYQNCQANVALWLQTAYEEVLQRPIDAASLQYWSGILA